MNKHHVNRIKYYDYTDLVWRLDLLQQSGTAFYLVDDPRGIGIGISLPRHRGRNFRNNLAMFVYANEVLIKRWLQSQQKRDS